MKPETPPTEPTAKRTRRKRLDPALVDAHAQTLAETKAAVLALLQQAKLVFDEVPDPKKPDARPVKLYLVDATLREALVDLRRAHDTTLSEDDRLKAYRFDRLVKFINPDTPASNWNVVVHPAFVQVNRDESIAEYAPASLEVSLNVYKKQLREQFKDAEALKRALTELDREAQNARQQLEEMLAAPERYDVRISTKKRAYDYAYVHMNARAVYLSDQRPNVLYFETPEFRPNDAHSRFMQQAANLFGDIYYTLREPLAQGEEHP